MLSKLFSDNNFLSQVLMNYKRRHSCNNIKVWGKAPDFFFEFIMVGVVLWVHTNMHYFHTWLTSKLKGKLETLENLGTWKALHSNLRGHGLESNDFRKSSRTDFYSESSD